MTSKNNPADPTGLRGLAIVFSKPRHDGLSGILKVAFFKLFESFVGYGIANVFKDTLAVEKTSPCCTGLFNFTTEPAHTFIVAMTAQMFIKRGRANRMPHRAKISP
ncbi:MAG: hypothetical protein OXC62_13485 [Aestuariivita sp.]|nr:hypothetical protein [Aestuariivita sp.]